MKDSEVESVRSELKRRMKGANMTRLAREIGVSRVTLYSFRDGNEVQPDTIGRVRAYLQAPAADSNSLDYWRGRVEQIAESLRSVLADQDKLVQSMRDASRTGKVLTVRKPKDTPGTLTARGKAHKIATRAEEKETREG